ncbi:hypothetical protein [Acidovorax sp.]|uniref:hypothetical protein n=1 Tax=Acidovorax sp. TaxID=1872122 RepID=UPI00391FA01A
MFSLCTRLALLAGLSFASAAQAELTNISTNALQSQNTETSGCTIVGRGGKSLNGLKYLVILAEGKSSDSDPTLIVKSLNLNPAVTLTNDNWRDPTVQNGVPLPFVDFSPLLRAPAKLTDSAVLIYVTPDVALCAFSKEKTGGDALRAVSVSITDVTGYIQGATSLELKEEAIWDGVSPAMGVLR